MKKLYINKMVETFKPGWWQVYAIQNEEKKDFLKACYDFGIVLLKENEMKKLKAISEEEKLNYFKEISKNQNIEIPNIIKEKFGLNL